MKDSKDSVESGRRIPGIPGETPVREPLFRRYQIKVKAGVRTGAVPTGRPPLGF
jgi:hypothetical protein